MPYAIGIDIGGTNIKAVCVSPDGEVAQRHSYATEDRPGESGERLARRVGEVIEQIRGGLDDEARWLGLASPGLARPDGAEMVWMAGRMEQVVGLNWTTALGWPRPAPVLNDAHAALLGEVWQGAAKGARDAVLLTLGTGVGGAILSDGRIVKGHLGRAGHLGHITLDAAGEPDIVATPGSLEDAIGECTIKQRTAGRFTSTKDLVEAHEAGDVDATRLWLNAVYGLAVGIVSIVNAVDPQFVILGGGIARAGDSLFKPLAAFLDRVEWVPTGERVRIVPAKLGEFAGAIGAAYNAMNVESE